MTSTARTRASRKYNERCYDRLYIIVPRGRKRALEAFARSSGYESTNACVNALIRAFMGLTEEEWRSVEEPGDGDAHGLSEAASREDRHA